MCSDLREVNDKNDCLKADSEGWYEVKTFSGSGDKTTESFKINSEKWRYSVTCVGQHKSTGLSYSLRVYKLIESEPSNVHFIASANCESNIEPNYIYDGKGEYFFKFDTANADGGPYTAIDSLTIKVEAVK